MNSEAKGGEKIENPTDGLTGVYATVGNVVAHGVLWWFERMCGMQVVGVEGSWQSNSLRAKLELVVTVNGFPISWQANCGSKGDWCEGRLMEALTVHPVLVCS